MKFPINSIAKGLSLATISALFFACSAPTPKVEGYQINGTIHNTAMEKIYLNTLNDKGWEVIDSSEVKDGHYSFKGKVNSPEFYAISSKNNSFGVRVLVSNDLITIASDFQKPDQDTITGSSAQDEYEAVQDSLQVFDDLLNSFVDQYAAAREKGDTVTMDAIEISFDKSDKLREKWMIDWIMEHPKSAAAQLLVINPLMYQLAYEDLRPIYDNIDTSVQGSSMYALIKKRVDILENSSVGKPAPDFSMADTTGAMTSLSDQYGTYVLIDFWASWCGPCRFENPQMVGIYDKYHDKGYNVFGVSLDNKKDAWIQAIGEDNLNWAHVSDLKGWQSEAAALYGVTSIPHTVLIDPKGVIVARGLRGDELEAKLASIFEGETAMAN